MDVFKRHLTDAELAEYFLQLDVSTEKINDNYRAEALILQQTDPEKGYPRLVKNMQTYGQGLSIELPVETIPVRLMLNKTRVQSLTSSTFEIKVKESAEQVCFLCTLDKGQHGIIIPADRTLIDRQDQQFIILTNPGITLPGDLTIATIRHTNQLIADRFSDMIHIARSLYNFSIYFNGALAGASSTHFHFQAGYKDKLIGESQIQRLLAGQPVGQARLKRILKRKGLEAYNVENYLRATHLVVAKDAQVLLGFFNHYLSALTEISHSIKGIPNVPDFGGLIPSLGIMESEPRINIMLKYYPDYEAYIAALFPKQFNRPQCYFKKGRQQILLGLAIKEALGNLITVREADYEHLKNDPSLITKIYSDTSINAEMVEELNKSLKLK
ncbi:MAG: DUF4922 domain-containing protein [Candidatus Neomarinimicrobiota bacterium]